MSRKMYVNVTVRLIIDADEDIQLSEVIQEMDYNFAFLGDGAFIEDSEILDYELNDSK